MKKSSIIVLIMATIQLGCGRDYESKPVCESEQEFEFYTDSTIQMYQYPSGETGSLPREWKTGEKGIPIKKSIKCQKITTQKMKFK